MTRHKLILLWLLIAAGALAACEGQKPILVLVTPTPQATLVGAEGTPVPTLQPTRNAPPTPTATVTPIPPTPLPATGLPTTTPANTGPTPTFLGSILELNYTLPPSSTPRPTATPPPSLTPTQGPSPTPAPTDTPSAPGVVPTGLPSLDRNRVGIQIDPMLKQQDWNEVMRRVKELNVGWLKVQLPWELMQPGGPDDFPEDFGRMQLYIQDAKKNYGVKILVSIAKAPDWARSARGEDGPPDDPRTLANFLTFYLEKQKLGEVTDAIEIWNEPNLNREWQGHPMTGGEYMRYFAPAYDAIRAYSKSIIVVTAGLAPTGTQPGAVNDRDYLGQMYAAGLGRYTDVAVGIHPYGWGNPPDVRCCDKSDVRGWDDDPHFFFINNVEDYRQIMTRNGHTNAQLWTTEFGWATWQGFIGDPPDKWMTYNDRWAQANYAIRALQIGQGLDYMGPMMLWNLNFANTALIERRDERAGYSILMPPGQPERPLYWMLFDALRPEVDLQGKYGS